jgi:SMC interacting uncharacterized protein involved in chromosome segregation
MKRMTEGEIRRRQIMELRKQVEALKMERKQQHKIAEEKAELKRLMSEVHPSKIHKLAEVVGKSTELTPERKKSVVSALRALKKAGKEFNKVRAEIRKYGQRER